MAPTLLPYPYIGPKPINLLPTAYDPVSEASSSQPPLQKTEQGTQANLPMEATEPVRSRNNVMPMMINTIRPLSRSNKDSKTKSLGKNSRLGSFERAEQEINNSSDLSGPSKLNGLSSLTHNFLKSRSSLDSLKKIPENGDSQINWRLKIQQAEDITRAVDKIFRHQEYDKLLTKKSIREKYVKKQRKAF